MQVFVKYQDDVGQSLNQGFELSLYDIIYNVIINPILNSSIENKSFFIKPILLPQICINCVARLFGIYILVIDTVYMIFL